MVDHQLGDHFQISLVGLVQKFFELFDIAVSGMNLIVIRNIVAVVFQGDSDKRAGARWLLSRFPADSRAFATTFEVADAISVAVPEGLDMKLINNGIFIPVQFIAQGRTDVHIQNLI